MFGNVVGTQSFFPFGEVRPSATGVFDTERGFTGQIRDAATGLNFYNARYYDTALGKFISPDSIVPNPANPADYNRFVYVYSNPLRYTDPSGHCVLGLPCPELVEDAVEFAIDVVQPTGEAVGNALTKTQQAIIDGIWKSLELSGESQYALKDALEGPTGLKLGSEFELVLRSGDAELNVGVLLLDNPDGNDLVLTLALKPGIPDSSDITGEWTLASIITTAESHEEYREHVLVHDLYLIQIKKDPNDPSGFTFTIGGTREIGKSNNNQKDEYWNSAS